MKDNIFSHWLKELCSLVFIQTIQAFIFAIVISLIISIMTPENIGEIGTDNRDDYISAVGIIAIIALASVSKLEELVKKIFGVQSNITDTGMRGGMKSLATTMMAANLAKGVLDNAGKVVGGIAGVRSANSSMNKQRARLARKIEAESKVPTNNEATLNEARETEQLNTNKNSSNSSSNSSNRPITKNSEISDISNSNRRKAMSKDLQKAYDDYEDKMEELKQKRRASRFKAISGGTETLGALGGGVTGAIIGASVGEGKEILNGSLAGIGIGDKIGAAPINVAQAASNFSYAVSDVVKQRGNLVREVNNMNDQAREAIKNKKALTTKYSAARKELDKQLKSFDVSDL